MTDPAQPPATQTRAAQRSRLPSIPWVETLAFLVMIALMLSAGA